MEPFSIVFGISVFIAGVLMFLAPCTLPLIPSYIAFIGGINHKKVEEPQQHHETKRVIMANSLAFVIGFSVVFIFFGLIVGLFGSYIGQFKLLLSQVGGIVIIFFGLYMLDVVKFLPFAKEYKIPLPTFMKPGNPVSSFTMGATFAFGWTPCVGPVLASVLLLASSSADILSGGILLALFSLGLAIPFLLTAVLYAQASKFIAKLSRASHAISIIGGLFLIFLGILLLTSNFGLMLEYGYRLFYLLGIDGIFNYL